MAILDERIEKSPRRKPDVGVVIDPSRSTAPVAWSPTKGGLPSLTKPMFDPSEYIDLEDYCTRKLRFFEPHVPSRIVIANRLETPVQYILESPYSHGGMQDFTFLFWFRLLIDEQTIDLGLSSKQLSPWTTLQELVEKQAE
ncbi:MAG: hypothetical protein ACTHN7_04795 [Solirubrobacterales bacterium]